MAFLLSYCFVQITVVRAPADRFFPCRQLTENQKTAEMREKDEKLMIFRLRTHKLREYYVWWPRHVFDALRPQFLLSLTTCLRSKFALFPPFLDQSKPSMSAKNTRGPRLECYNTRIVKKYSLLIFLNWKGQFELTRRKQTDEIGACRLR